MKYISENVNIGYFFFCKSSTVSYFSIELPILSKGNFFLFVKAVQSIPFSNELPILSKGTIPVFFVADPPGPPAITGYTVGEAIRAGEERTLTCRSRGGNPLGRVVWYRNNENIDSTDRHVGAESVNEYKFIVDSSDNGAVYTCEVRNKLTDKPLLTSVKLDVQCKCSLPPAAPPLECKFLFLLLMQIFPFVSVISLFSKVL